MPSKLKPLIISELFSNKNKFSIPIYQRNYSWGEKEITQLIQDIADFSLLNNKKNYYLGSLVVHEKKYNSDSIYEVIDGQQRLTTLTVLLSALKNHQSKLGFTNDISWYTLNITFDSREKSTKTLNTIFAADKFDTQKEFHADLKQAYADCLKILCRILAENDQKITDFCSYLFEKVVVLRVPVPEDTDLNHYFEIMNNRGEQLEKHEVLKTMCLEYLSDNDSYTETFHIIWEACANIEKYVQYGFNTKERDLIFGKKDWDSFVIDSFDQLASLIAPHDHQNLKTNHAPTILEILDGKNADSNTGTRENENPDHFNSVINFSNFLLHVLRIQEQNDKIALDDKRLISIFESTIDNKKNEGANIIEFIKLFAFNLLKCKFLFDKYIIKREFADGTDNWSLKKLKCYDKNKTGYINTFSIDNKSDNETNNKTALMLLAMFHVSAPTLVYKHWLNACLKFLFENPETTVQTYIDFLENLSKAFLYDRFLSADPIDYFTVIYNNNSIATNKKIDLEKLNQGTLVENFIFNYLDYLLWSEDKVRFSNFKFSFRSSVEHYYPQNPPEGMARLDQKDVDKFGNLCLISSSTNSRLWHLPPEGKRKYFNSIHTHESIKQKIMMDYENWTLEEIYEHQEKMISILNI